MVALQVPRGLGTRAPEPQSRSRNLLAQYRLEYVAFSCHRFFVASRHQDAQSTDDGSGVDFDHKIGTGDDNLCERRLSRLVQEIRDQLTRRRTLRWNLAVAQGRNLCTRRGHQKRETRKHDK